MKQYFILFLILFFYLVSCNDQQDDIYDFLNICNDEFYLDYGVLASEKMNIFHQELIDEGHLVDDSGHALKVLLRNLAKKTYFDPPLRKDDFNNALLYKYPDQLYGCVTKYYNIDSSSIANLPFTETQEKIAIYASNSESIPVQGFFKIYAEELTDEELSKPYIKESILLFLYRWYFQSKYDREIPINLETNKNEHD